MKKIINLVLGCALCLGFASTGFAQSLKIGVVDLHQLVAESAHVKKVRVQLETQFKPRQTKLLALQNGVKADMDKLKRDGAIMSESQKQALQDKIMNNKQAFERQGRDYQQDLTMAQNKAMQSFFEKVKKVVDKVAANEKYDLVLQKEGVPYVGANVDITAKVAKAL